MTNSPEREVNDLSVSGDGHINSTGQRSPVSPMSAIRSNSIQYDVKPNNDYQNMRHSQYIVHNSLERKAIIKSMTPGVTNKRPMAATSYTDVVRPNTSITAHDEASPPQGMTVIPTTNGTLMYIYCTYPRTHKLVLST